MKTDKTTLVGEQGQVSAAAEEAKAGCGKGKLQASGLLWPGIVALAALLYLGLGYLMNALTRESTDDAFIEGRIVSIAPKISGQISAVYATDNQVVNKGDQLVEIDPRDYEMRLMQKRVSADTSQANLKTVVSAFDLMKAKVATAEA